MEGKALDLSFLSKTKEKYSKCEVCGAEILKKNLNKHKKSKTCQKANGIEAPIPPFTCIFCSKGISFNKKRHIKNCKKAKEWHRKYTKSLGFKEDPDLFTSCFECLAEAYNQAGIEKAKAVRKAIEAANMLFSSSRKEFASKVADFCKEIKKNFNEKHAFKTTETYLKSKNNFNAFVIDPPIIRYARGTHKQVMRFRALVDDSIKPLTFMYFFSKGKGEDIVQQGQCFLLRNFWCKEYDEETQKDSSTANSKENGENKTEIRSKQKLTMKRNEAATEGSKEITSQKKKQFILTGNEEVSSIRKRNVGGEIEEINKELMQKLEKQKEDREALIRKAQDPKEKQSSCSPSLRMIANENWEKRLDKDIQLVELDIEREENKNRGQLSKEEFMKSWEEAKRQEKEREDEKKAQLRWEIKNRKKIEEFDRSSRLILEKLLNQINN